jgi:hypothetical protein
MTCIYAGFHTAGQFVEALSYKPGGLGSYSG